MRRFIIEYANYQLANNPFLYNSVCGQFYNRRINSAVEKYRQGFITTNEAMEMILRAEEYAMQESRTE